MSDQHNSQQKPEQFPPEDDDDNILDELKAQLFTFVIFGLIGLFFYGFVQFLASFEPKTRAKFADVPVEERLANLPQVFSYLYTQSKFIFAEKLPAIQYWDFKWNHQKMPYKLYQFEISEDVLSEQQFNDIYQPKLIQQGWSEIPTTKDTYYPIELRVDYTFIDGSGHRTFITRPMHNQERPAYWKISMVENSGIFEYQQ